MTAVRTWKSVVSDRERATALAYETFELLRTRWALRVLEALAPEAVGGERAGPGRVAREAVRFNQLQRDLEPIRHKVLTSALRDLESRGLVVRRDYDTALPHVEYSLTSAGQQLLTTVHGLCDWSAAHLRSLFDE